jgi:hypothetical protein
MTDPYRPDLVAGLFAVLIGAAVAGGLAYAAATPSVTDADYAAYEQRCENLTEESRLVDAGLGTETVPLNETDVRACENTSFEAYERARLRSMRSTPLNAVQWGWLGGTGVAFLAIGGRLITEQIGDG